MKNLSLVKPTYIDLELTNACPADCPMCPRDKLPSIGIMSEKVFTSVLEFIESNKEKLYISLCGIGEPLLHPKILEYVERLKNVSIKPYVCIITAGEKLTPEMFEKLKNLGIDEIILSLQAVDEILYKKLMPGLKFDKVIKNIEYISQNKSPSLNFKISLTVHKMNEHNVKDILKFAQSKNIKVKVNNVHTRGGNMLDSSLTDLPVVDASPLKSCKIFETINFISWTGDIHPCCQDVERLYKLGNVESLTMDDIILHKTDALANGLKYSICSKCNDEHRSNILAEKNIDLEQQIKKDQELCFEICKNIGILGENFLSNLVAFKNPQELLSNIEEILKDISRTLNVLTYLRKKYPHLSVEINSLEKNQLIDENILKGMNLNREHVTQEQLDQIYSYLLNKYGLFSENIFEKILIMPKQQIISLVYKHFTDVHQFINKDLNLIFLWKEKMVKKQVSLMHF